MMLRSLLLLGLLFAPLHAAAQAELTALPPAISPFTQGVLDRSDALLREYVPSLGETEECESSLDNAMEQSLNEIRKVYDAQVSMIEQAKSVGEHTLCLRYDLLLLEERMHDVREAITDASRACESLAQLKTLSSIHTFLFQAYESVMLGGPDPRYADFRLRQSLPFIPEDNPLREGDEQATACPFHSDYGPPASSYGCSADVLQRVFFDADDDIVTEEMKSEARQTADALRNLEGFGTLLRLQIDTFEQTFFTILSRIRGGVPQQSDAPPASPAEEDGPFMGCKEETVTDPDSGEVLPFAVRTWEPEDLPDALLLRSNRDAFGIVKNPLMTLRQFMIAQFQRGSARPLPVAPPPVTYFGAVRQDGDEARRRAQSAILSQEQARVTAGSTDALERVYDSVSSLREAVRTFGTLSSFPKEGAAVTKNGRTYQEPLPLLRGYTRDLALFLRRSCVYGFCSDTLDAVLQRVTNNSCFPYGTLCFRDNEDYVQDCYDNVVNEC